MPRLHRDEHAPASRADFSVCRELCFNGRAIRRGAFHHPRLKFERHIDRRWTQELDRILRCYGARRFWLLAPRAVRRGRRIDVHQVPSRRPVRMTIKQGADDAAIQYAGESLMVRLGLPRRYNLIILGHATNSKALCVGGATSKTNTFWRVLFL